MTSVALVSMDSPGEQSSTGSRSGGIASGFLANGFDVSRVHAIPDYKKWHRRARPWWYWRRTPATDASLDQRISEDTALVVLSYLPVAAISIDWVRKHRPDSLVIYDAQNDQVALAEKTGNPRHAAYIRSLEDELATKVDAITVAGLEDQRSLQSRYPDARILNLPHAVDDAPLVPPAPNAERAFTYGHWSWRANADGLRNLALGGHVEGELSVYGRVPDGLRRELEASTRHAATRWVFRGFAPTLDDMASDAASPVIVPIWAGAGVASRTAQMAGRGIPVVGPAQTARGLPDWFAAGLLIDDDPTTILELAFGCGDAEWRRAHELGKRLHDEYSWPACVRDVLRHLNLPTPVAKHP